MHDDNDDDDDYPIICEYGGISVVKIWGITPSTG